MAGLRDRNGRGLAALAVTVLLASVCVVFPGLFRGQPLVRGPPTK
jgi:hypothetical protein